MVHETHILNLRCAGLGARPAEYRKGPDVISKSDRTRHRYADSCVNQTTLNIYKIPLKRPKEVHTIFFFAPKNLAILKPRGKNFGYGFFDVSELPESESELRLFQKNLVQLVGKLMPLTVLNCSSSTTSRQLRCLPLHISLTPN